MTTFVIVLYKLPCKLWHMIVVIWKLDRNEKSAQRDENTARWL